MHQPSPPMKRSLAVKWGPGRPRNIQRQEYWTQVWYSTPTYLHHRAIASMKGYQYSLEYTSVDEAIRILLTLGVGAQMAKIDLKSAFRMVPVHPDNWSLVGMHWRDSYYVDTCIPFGLLSAPFL